MNNEIFDDVQKEMERQDKKWGEQNHTLIEWIAILTEEVGEAAQMAVKHHFKESTVIGGKITGELPSIATQEGRLFLYRRELIQVAAVAVQAVKNLDKYF